MLSIFNKLIKDNILLIFLVIFILFISTNGKAETAHINYTDTNMYNKLKGELEGHGFTVTGTNPYSCRFTTALNAVLKRDKREL